jgi:penicillin-binding protein 2
LALSAAYLAKRGETYRPHLNKDLKPEKLPVMAVDNPKYWQLIIEPMRQVTQQARGTAFRFFNGSNLDVAGKTGTAQVFGIKQNEKYNHDKTANHLRDHSLFIGFAPATEPKIAIAVLLENQKASAGVARQVIEAYLAPKPRAPAVPTEPGKEPVAEGETKKVETVATETEQDTYEDDEESHHHHLDEEEAPHA